MGELLEDDGGGGDGGEGGASSTFSCGCSTCSTIIKTDEKVASKYGLVDVELKLCDEKGLEFCDDVCFI